MAEQFLGFDLSTQQLKALIVTADLKKAFEAKVDFDADLAVYDIVKGVRTNPALGEVFAPVVMFLHAIDLVLKRLQDEGADFSKVQGISGAGMQHGTVFWSAEGEKTLASLDADKSLLENLEKAFSNKFSPNWQDASTQEQCTAFDKALDTPANLAVATGSSAHHRFSGPQIQRFRENQPDAYAATSRISLVSSFLASVFLGKVAPIDISDVCGANLWDIKHGCWQETLLALAAGEAGPDDLKKKLGDIPEDGGARFGNIAPYFVRRYNFPQSCQIIPFTGDNPATILALPLRSSDAIVSLGTSTTFLMSTPEYKPNPAYHFMNHPTTAGLYMFMLCYKNGALAREHIRNDINAALNPTTPTETWDNFNTTVLSTPILGQTNPATDPAHLGIFFPRPEIVPNVHAGSWRYLYTQDGALVDKNSSPETAAKWKSPHDDARAILESQFLSLRLRSRDLVEKQGSLPAQPRRVYLVGGGAVNPAIALLAGEVLGGADGVYKLDIGGNACALGGAYKAAWGVLRKEKESFEDFLGERWNEEQFVKKIDRGYREGVWERYGEALKGFEGLEGVILGEGVKGGG
ncbi:D-xylulose kinase-like protein [Amniculicola lignicola CBS 123094]|uniref:Xylulose kinase n=1 Tax=Amniculicola lignicola CBS 123094 TaxID=1392246 RepID=A0A6A5W9N9_9PLEO|nr:D-xylulose kinase-like protein [Amniculicola lignicola CBS 123094]